MNEIKFGNAIRSDTRIKFRIRLNNLAWDVWACLVGLLVIGVIAGRLL